MQIRVVNNEYYGINKIQKGDIYMENELNEVMEVGVSNELENVSRKPSKVAIFGIAAAAITGLVVAFRKKIGARMEKRMVKKLTKKGYTVYEPELEVFSDNTVE